MNMRNKTVIIDNLEDMILTFQVGNSSVERIVKMIKENRKEIKRLTAESTEWESKFYDEARKVDKAIEYIEQQRLHKFQDTTGGLTYNERKLLDILKGVDKE